jgi:hypothetical protein
MIAFDPNEIDVKIKDVIVNDDDKLNATWEMKAPTRGGTAYYRIDPKFRDFLMLCQEKHGVIGFEYDFKEGDLNLGVVLKK